ncbi:MAG: GNAT family N-acetyltransferase [Planctomycetes bacterium]|nr:GNAT family N-acetyltransferase [Planctomycetota bacterium]NBY02115.1 GNAT family N-acetyltransferase [Planctomycetota bacterium]
MDNFPYGIAQLMPDSFLHPESDWNSGHNVSGHVSSHDGSLNKSYLKRYRMELDFNPKDKVFVPELPENYAWQEWTWKVQEMHAEVIFESFHKEMDCQIFSSFHTLGGCSMLMREICLRAEFVPEATWLINAPEGPCGSIQAILQKGKTLAIQNVGVTPQHRKKGLGKALLLKLISSLESYNLNKITLEVSAQNLAAIQLYRNLGFRKTKLIYKEILSFFIPS